MLRNVIAILCCLLFPVHTPTRVGSGATIQIDDKIISYEILSKEMSYGRYCIDILVDEKDFSVDNLKILLVHFFKANPSPKRMRVFVATSKSQVADFAVYSDPSKRPAALHPYGGLHREKGKEFIRYKLPNEGLKTIVIKEGSQ